MASRSDVIDMLRTALAALESEQSMDAELDGISNHVSEVYTEAEELAEMCGDFGSTSIDDAKEAAAEMAQAAERVKEKMEDLRVIIDSARQSLAV